MTDLYQWNSSDMQQLQRYTDSVSDVLTKTLTTVTALVSTMDGDVRWQSDQHKATFMAWMDLVKQYHQLLASGDIGEAALAGLKKFSAALDDYYDTSELHATLRSIK